VCVPIDDGSFDNLLLSASLSENERIRIRYFQTHFDRE